MKRWLRDAQVGDIVYLSKLFAYGANGYNNARGVWVKVTRKCDSGSFHCVAFAGPEHLLDGRDIYVDASDNGSIRTNNIPDDILTKLAVWSLLGETQ